MHTLIYNAQRIGSSNYYIKLTSDIDASFLIVKQIPADKLETFLQHHNSQIIASYLHGFVLSRIKAYQAKSPTAFARRIKQLQNLAHYLGRKHQNAPAIYTLAIKWENLLINSLPATENLSHAKVRACIASSYTKMAAYSAANPLSIHTHQFNNLHK